MATVAEVLKQSGFTDEQIAAFDARAITAFTGVLTTAEQAQADAVAKAAKAETDYQASKAAKEAAEIEKRSTAEFWENGNKNVTYWDEQLKAAQTEKANAEALAAFYKAQNESAKGAGFIPKDAPEFTPTVPARAPNGQYVPNAPGSTPGSPTFTMTEVRDNLGSVMGTLTDIQWKYSQLYDGKPMPMAPTELVKQAEARKLDPAIYAAQVFNFQGREQELAQKSKELHESAIRLEESNKAKTEYEAKEKALRDEFAVKERKFAESNMGNNPDVRQTVPSKIAEVQRAVADGKRADPLKMNDNERQNATRQSIRERILERQGTAA